MESADVNITKQCSKCNKFKPIAEFTREILHFGKYPKLQEVSHCHECHTKRRVYLEKYNNEISRVRKIDPEKKKLYNAKRAAKKQQQKSIQFCYEYNCENLKCLIAHNGRCFQHGGIHQVFKQMHVTMIRNTKDGKKPCFKTANLLDIPDVNLLHHFFILQNGICPYCGINLLIIHGQRNINAVSVDRIDSDVAYVPTNVCITCLWCNFAKQNSKLKDFLIALDLLLRQIPNILSSMDLSNDLNLFHSFCEMLPLSNIMGHEPCKKVSKFTYWTANNDKEKERLVKKCSSTFVYHQICTQQFRDDESGIPFCLCQVPYCPLRPSVDRLDNSIRGHSDLQNNRMICMFMNLGRNDMTLEELHKVINQRVISYKTLYARKQAKSTSIPILVDSFVSILENNDLNSWLQQPALSLSEQMFEPVGVGSETEKKLAKLRNSRHPNHAKSSDLFILRNSMSPEDFVQKANSTIVQYDETVPAKPLAEYVIRKWWKHRSDEVEVIQVPTVDAVKEAFANTPPHLLKLYAESNKRRKLKYESSEASSSSSVTNVLQQVETEFV